MAAEPMVVWEVWTSNERISSWWGPPQVNIRLEIGSAFELLSLLDATESERGSDGCRVLSYVPGESLSFT